MVLVAIWMNYDLAMVTVNDGIRGNQMNSSIVYFKFYSLWFYYQMNCESFFMPVLWWKSQYVVHTVISFNAVSNGIILSIRPETLGPTRNTPSAVIPLSSLGSSMNISSIKPGFLRGCTLYLVARQGVFARLYSFLGCFKSCRLPTSGWFSHWTIICGALSIAMFDSRG